MCFSRMHRADAACVSMHTHPINDKVQHNMPNLLVAAFEHIHQARYRVAMCARDVMLRHVKSGDCHTWLRYLQLLAQPFEGIEIMVIMEYIRVKPSRNMAFCDVLPPAKETRHMFATRLIKAVQQKLLWFDMAKMSSAACTLAGTGPDSVGAEVTAKPL